MTDVPVSRSSDDIIEAAVASLRRDLVRGYHADAADRLLTAVHDHRVNRDASRQAARVKAKRRARMRTRLQAASRKANRRAA